MRLVCTALLSSIALLIAVPANCQIFGNFGEPAWSRMFKYFEFRMVGGNLAKDDQIFVLPIATNAAWDDHIRTFRLMEMNKWGNQMPSDSWVYAVNSNKTISEGYQVFSSICLGGAGRC
jgi:hypothetical protein